MLQNGSRFPSLEFERAGGGEIRVPEDLAGGTSVVLFHRGGWCPYCNAQLAAFARATDELAAEGVKVVSISADDRETSEETVEKPHIDFPIGCGADVEAVARATGAFVNESPRCLQATGFILDDTGRILTAVYSSRAIGRLTPDDVIGFIRHLNSKGSTGR